jgi:CRP-like cAMP-binding protein
VRVLKLGDVAGLESVFEPRYEYSAIAVGSVQACRIPMHHFHEFLGRYPSLQRRLIERSQAALRDAHTWLAQIVGGTTPVRIRLARLLLNLRIGDTDRMIRFSGDDMAAILGSTPETVSRAVSEFVRLGILNKTCGSKNNRVFRGDIAALEAIAREA